MFCFRGLFFYPLGKSRIGFLGKSRIYIFSFLSFFSLSFFSVHLFKRPTLFWSHPKNVHSVNQSFSFVSLFQSFFLLLNTKMSFSLLLRLSLLLLFSLFLFLSSSFSQSVTSRSLHIDEILHAVRHENCDNPMLCSFASAFLAAVHKHQNPPLTDCATRRLLITPPGNAGGLSLFPSSCGFFPF